MSGSRRTSVTYEFPWPPRELSPNARVHWASRAKATVGYKLDVGWEVKLVGVVSLAPPVTAQVTFVVTDSRRRDADNHLAMLKPMWDALVALGVLVDDNKDALKILDPKWERGKTRRVIVELDTHVLEG